MAAYHYLRDDGLGLRSHRIGEHLVDTACDPHEPHLDHRAGSIRLGAARVSRVVRRFPRCLPTMRAPIWAPAHCFNIRSLIYAMESHYARSKIHCNAPWRLRELSRSHLSRNSASTDRRAIPTPNL